MLTDNIGFRILVPPGVPPIHYKSACDSSLPSLHAAPLSEDNGITFTLTQLLSLYCPLCIQDGAICTIPCGRGLILAWILRQLKPELTERPKKAARTIYHSQIM